MQVQVNAYKSFVSNLYGTVSVYQTFKKEL